MEKIKDILNNLKDRFSNPIIFSFLCSWMLINWQITVSLFWYDPRQMQSSGAKSIYGFIESKINFWDCFFKPFCCSVLYTILSPVSKNIISAFYAWTTKWGSNWNLQILKGANFPFEKYLKLKEDYERRSEILEEVITSEGMLTEKYQTVNTELLQVKSDFNSLSQREAESKNTLIKLYDFSILNGYWVNSYKDDENSRLNGTEDVFIQNGKYYLIEKFGTQKHVFNILNFYHDNRNSTIFFIKERIDFPNKAELRNGHMDLRYNINWLKIEREDLLVGVENGTTKIEYQKKYSLKLKEDA